MGYGPKIIEIIIIIIIIINWLWLMSLNMRYASDESWFRWIHEASAFFTNRVFISQNAITELKVVNTLECIQRLLIITMFLTTTKEQGQLHPCQRKSTHCKVTRPRITNMKTFHSYIQSKVKFVSKCILGSSICYFHSIVFVQILANYQDIVK